MTQVKFTGSIRNVHEVPLLCQAQVNQGPFLALC